MNDVIYTTLIIIDRLLQAISPHICKLCGRVGSPYCNGCTIYTISQDYQVCLYCGKPTKQANLCKACHKSRSPFVDLYCINQRQDGLKRLIGDYKYRSQVACARPIADMLSQRIKDLPSDTVVIPVPTIARHVRVRGFDHAALLGWLLAKQLKLKFDSQLIYRTNNLIQHNQSRAKRLRLIKTSIAVRHRLSMPKHVLLIDDIWTTGATMSAVASLLKQSGVKNIYGAVAVRQPHHK